jgi:NitT/TauT family transport system permease protein
MRKHASLLWQVLGVLLIIMLWLVIESIVSEPLLMPSIPAVLRALIALFPSGSTVLLTSMSRLLMILMAALISGVGCGLLASLKQPFAHVIRASITLLRTIPVISVIVLVLIVVGFELTPFIVTYLIVFPQIYQATKDSVDAIDSTYVDVYKLEHRHDIRSLWQCYIPLIAVPLSTAILQAAGLGIKVLVMTEYLSQTPRSIGYVLYRAKTDLRYDVVFAWTLVLILMILLIEMLITTYKKRHSSD